MAVAARPAYGVCGCTTSAIFATVALLGYPVLALVASPLRGRGLPSRALLGIMVVVGAALAGKAIGVVVGRITLEGYGHSTILRSTWTARAVERYLLEVVLPSRGTVCAPDFQPFDQPTGRWAPAPLNTCASSLAHSPRAGTRLGAPQAGGPWRPLWTRRVRKL